MKKSYSRIHKMPCVVVGADRPKLKELMEFARKLGAVKIEHRRKPEKTDTEFFCIKVPWGKGSGLYSRGALRVILESVHFREYFKLGIKTQWLK